MPANTPSYPSEKSLTFLMKEYLEHLSTRHYTPSTLEGREKELRRFVNWAKERAVLEPPHLNREVLELYQRYLFHYRRAGNKPLAAHSQYKLLSALHHWFRWMVKKRLLLYDPSDGLELPRLPQRLPRDTLTLEEVERILSQPDTATALGLRDRAILETLYSTGIRRSELAHLALYDVRASDGTIFIRQGKGQKDRLLPLAERVWLWMERYLRHARPEFLLNPEESAFFITSEGKPFNPDALTHLTRRYIKLAEVNKTGSCHLFRHTMATLMLEGGADLRCVQEMLGHSSLSATQIYTKISIQRLKAAHTLAHPGSLIQEPSEEEPTEEEGN